MKITKIVFIFLRAEFTFILRENSAEGYIELRLEDANGETLDVYVASELSTAPGRRALYDDIAYALQAPKAEDITVALRKVRPQILRTLEFLALSLGF